MLTVDNCTMNVAWALKIKVMLVLMGHCNFMINISDISQQNNPISFIIIPSDILKMSCFLCVTLIVRHSTILCFRFIGQGHIKTILK